MTRHTIGPNLNEQQPLGDDPPLAGPRPAAVLDGVFKVEQHPRGCAEIPLIDQDSASAKQVAIALKREVDRRVEKRVTWTNERRGWLSWRCELPFLERNTFITREHRLAATD